MVYDLRDEMLNGEIWRNIIREVSTAQKNKQLNHIYATMVTLSAHTREDNGYCLQLLATSSDCFTPLHPILFELKKLFSLVNYSLFDCIVTRLVFIK